LLVDAGCAGENGIHKFVAAVEVDTCHYRSFDVRNGLFSSTKEYNWNDIVSADVFISKEEVCGGWNFFISFILAIIFMKKKK
jgi:hypothetical protein